jgi:predicted GIY-YIG superfamily endonuclease
MIDYSKTIIYRLYCKDTSIKEIYVGYTTDLRGRLKVHRSVCLVNTHKSHNQRTYTFIREHGGWDNWTYEILEEFSCNSKTEARNKEREWFDKLQPELNTNK